MRFAKAQPTGTECAPASLYMMSREHDQTETEPTAVPTTMTVREVESSRPFERPTAAQTLGRGLLWGAVAALLVAFVWSYWPTLVATVATWRREADYSHGFFVGPLALYFLWIRRDLWPEATGGAWWGLLLILSSVAMRWAAARYYLDQLDPWSIIVWLAGVVALIGGGSLLRWATPSILFLWFMFPLPFRAETMLSVPLRQAGTAASCWILQMLGQPALSEKYTILLGDQQLDVEQACAGLRIFMGVFALAFTYVVVVRRAWWEQLAVLASVIPIALAANVARIVATGLLYQYASGEAARRFSHDMAGWMMILLAAAMFAGELWYLERLYPIVEFVDIASLVQRERASVGDGGR